MSKQLAITLVLVLWLLISSVPCLAYTTRVGSVSWRNNGGYVYDSTGTLWTGDDFDGVVGSTLSSPPYVEFENPPITRNGDGTINLILSDTDVHKEVKLPNFDSTGNWMTAQDADFVVNFQTGTPTPGFGFSIEIDVEGLEPAEDDHVLLCAFTMPDGSFSGMLFFDDETTGPNPLTMMTLDELGISGFSSLALRFNVDAQGVCTPYYWINPADGILAFDDPSWVQFGTVTSQLDNNKLHDDISFQLNELTSPISAPVYRFWSPVYSRHFYTITESEKDKLVNKYSHVWTYEGVAYHAFPEQSDPYLVPVYRFWSSPLMAHFYTIKESEKDKLINNYADVWTYEGPAFYAYPQGAEPFDAAAVYRFWSDSLGCHFYTISESERDKLIFQYSNVWTYEGTAWYAYK